MPMQATKALFEVTAGVIPGTPMPEYGKSWGYTSDEYETDAKTPPGETLIFSARIMEAHSYAMSITNPAYVNWVRVDWMWVRKGGA